MSAVSAETAIAFDAKAHDARGFWRVLLAVIAPLPWLAQAVYYAGMPQVSTLDTEAAPSVQPRPHR